MSTPREKKRVNRLKIYYALREFHKDAVFNMLNMELSEWDRNTIETLNGVLYLCEGVFSREKL